MAYIITNGSSQVQSVPQATADKLIELGAAELSNQLAYTNQQNAIAAQNAAFTAAQSAQNATALSAKAKLIVLGFTEAEAGILAGGTTPNDSDVGNSGQG